MRLDQLHITIYWICFFWCAFWLYKGLIGNAILGYYFERVEKKDQPNKYRKFLVIYIVGFIISTVCLIFKIRILD